MNANNDLLTVKEVAKILRVDGTTVRRWITNGTLEYVPLPHAGKRKTYRIRRSTLDALLAKSTVETEDLLKQLDEKPLF